MPGAKNKTHKAKCQTYRLAGRREINKALKLVKHLARRPADQCARRAYEKLPLMAQKQHKLQEV